MAHAADGSIIGPAFAVPDNLKTALDGQVHARFEGLGDEEDRRETARGLPLPEVCSPVREALRPTRHPPLSGMRPMPVLR